VRSSHGKHVFQRPYRPDRHDTRRHQGHCPAYTSLGFEQAKTAPPEGGKHVVPPRREGDAFLSVYDSDNAALDTGELKELALAALKIFKTAARV
jgi:hypothetical protein